MSEFAESKHASSPFQDAASAANGEEKPSAPLLESQRKPLAASFDRLVEVNLALTEAVGRLVRIMYVSLGIMTAVEVLHLFRH